VSDRSAIPHCRHINLVFLHKERRDKRTGTKKAQNSAMSALLSANMPHAVMVRRDQLITHPTATHIPKALGWIPLLCGSRIRESRLERGVSIAVMQLCRWHLRLGGCKECRRKI
jgi:hypothetical protein